MAEARKGYSIWSLLVITTLLAVLFVLPQLFAPNSSNTAAHAMFFLLHQIAFWLTVGVLAWLVLGRHRIVMRFVWVILSLVWGPALLAYAESYVRNSGENTLVERTMRMMNVHEAYGYVYAAAYYSFDYANEH